MPRYHLHLHLGPKTPPVSETLDVTNDEDAKDLAQIALLAATEYTHAEVYRGDSLISTFKRDSYA